MICLRLAALLLVAPMLTGCVTSTTSLPVLPPGPEVPERFVAVLAEGGTEPIRPGEGCRSPLQDPGDGTQLRMVRSTAGVADYRVPDGRYGVGPGQLLRVSCDTGRPVGIVEG